MVDYPYLVTNKNMGAVLERIRTAAKPAKFTNNFVRQLGFTSTNDRAYAPLLKKLGFLGDEGTPTAYYDALRDQNTAKTILAERIRDLYSELFTINTEIHKASDDEIKGAIARVTGKDSREVTRIASTFKSLVSLADFSQKKSTVTSMPEKSKEQTQDNIIEKAENLIKPENSNPDFHYNIQIHLPATTDITVYNAIFKSIKEHLL